MLIRLAIAGALIMSTAVLCQSAAARPAAAAAISPDHAAIATVIESVATFADRRDFDALEALYAPEIRLDYSSLTGGEPEVVSPQALMTRWAGVLPGFDRTRHALSNVSVSIEREQANATAHIVADHWLGTQHWQVSGDYAYRLARDGRDWRITAHELSVTGEQGSRDIFGPATEAAKRGAVAYLQRQQSRQVVLDFLTGLEDKDMARVNGVWADDAVQEMPYTPANFPKRVVGKAALIKHYAAWPQNAGKAQFTNGIRFYPTRDPSIVVAEYHGITDIISTERTYDQRYIGLFHVDGGRITLFREYFDPTVFAYAFGLKEGGSFFQRN